MKKFVIVVLVIVVLAGFSLFLRPKQENYNFTGNAISYSERSKADYEVLDSWEEEGTEIRKIKFKTRPFQNQEMEIYGFLYLSEPDSPGFVFLPAGEATKESRKELLIDLAKQGYSSLAIDQRGVGETGGTFLWVNQDYQVLLAGYEPVQHLMVYDALKAHDVLREVQGVDRERTGFIGESMGGRYAIIASSLETKDKGAIIISSAGFNVQASPVQETNSYLMSIDPDNYIKNLDGYFLMLHGEEDEVVPLKNARITFEKAKEPKELIVTGCSHGYCEDMRESLLEGLETMFN
jgi:hypothetical protein